MVYPPAFDWEINRRFKEEIYIRSITRNRVSNRNISYNRRESTLMNIFSHCVFHKQCEFKNNITEKQEKAQLPREDGR